jgi:hypothetical protein
MPRPSHRLGFDGRRIANTQQPGQQADIEEIQLGRLDRALYRRTARADFSMRKSRFA